MGVPAWMWCAGSAARNLPAAFAGRPRSYCSVTCRQRAYRRRKAAARATKATETTEGGPAAVGGAGAGAGGRGRSASAEAIVIRVRVDEPAEVSRLPPAGAAGMADGAGAQEEGLFGLDELAEAALALARRLRSRRRAGEGGGSREEADGGPA